MYMYSKRPIYYKELYVLQSSVQTTIYNLHFAEMCKGIFVNDLKF